MFSSRKNFEAVRVIRNENNHACSLKINDGVVKLPDGLELFCLEVGGTYFEFNIVDKDIYQNLLSIDYLMENNDESQLCIYHGDYPEYIELDAEILSEIIESTYIKWKNKNKHLTTPLGRLLNGG